MKKAFSIALTLSALLLPHYLLADDYLFQNSPLGSSNFLNNTNVNIKHGWYWEDINTTKAKVKEEKKPKILKLINPKKDNRKPKQILTDIDNQLKLQTTLMSKIVQILEYNFPRRTPKYTINKKTGKKCLTNSSADCFVMPVVPEAQQVPVLKQFIRNPDLQSAKEWLRWFAKYQNKIGDIGYANSFAYAYPTRVTLESQTPAGNGDNIPRNIKEQTLMRLQNRIKIYVFYGIDKDYEALSDPIFMLDVKKGALSVFKDFTIVFKDKNYYDKLKKEFSWRASSREKSIANSTTFKLEPKLFKKFRIDHTPTVIAELKGKDGKILGWQKICFDNGYGDIVNGLYDFLVFNRVVKPTNINPENAYNAVHRTTVGKYKPRDMKGIKVQANKQKNYKLKFDKETQNISAPASK